MSVFEIVLYPDPALTTAGEDIEAVDDDVRGFLERLADTMYVASGVGLAANQVGDLRRMCVIDINEGEDRTSREGLIELINPKVVERAGELVWEEGCLSFPELHENVVRAARVRVEALDRHGKPFAIEGEGLLAVVLQHEIDHLDGVVFIDRISRLKRKMALKRYRKTLEARATAAPASDDGGDDK